MSYILDALKKAERERKRGKVPNVLTPQEGFQQSRAKRPVWAIFAIAALFLNAALLLWWFAPWKADSQRTVAVEPQFQTREDSVNRELSPVSRKEELPAAPRIQDERTSAESQARPATAIVPKLPKPGVALVPDNQRETGALTRGSFRAKKEERVKEPPPAAESADELPPAENRIYRVKELPDQLRKTLPDFSISAFLYAATPSSRMVRINGQMLREGEELSPGLQLEEITPDGVIMICRTYRFSIKVQ